MPTTETILGMCADGREHLARFEYGDAAVDEALRADGIDPDAGREEPAAWHPEGDPR